MEQISSDYRHYPPGVKTLLEGIPYPIQIIGPGPRLRMTDLTTATHHVDVLASSNHHQVQLTPRVKESVTRWWRYEHQDTPSKGLVYVLGMADMWRRGDMRMGKIEPNEDGSLTIIRRTGELDEDPMGWVTRWDGKVNVDFLIGMKIGQALMEGWNGQPPIPE